MTPSLGGYMFKWVMYVLRIWKHDQERLERIESYVLTYIEHAPSFISVYNIPSVYRRWKIQNKNNKREARRYT